MRRLAVVGAVAGFIVLSGCAKAAKSPNYAKLVAANPRSILVVPVVNKSVNIDAPAYFLSTLPVPVAERGYYVFPVNMVKRVLEDDGLSDASLVHGADPMRLCKLFGADSVLYVTIERWDAKYLVLSTSVNVEFHYEWKDGKTGDTLWVAHQAMTYQPQSSGGGLGGLIAAAINAAVTKAAPNYMPLARQANGMALAYPGPGFPAGPHRPEYRRDLAPVAGAPPEK
jgi:hypothetical protein